MSEEKLSIVISGLSPSDVLKMEEETVRKWLFDDPPFGAVSTARVKLKSASLGQVRRNSGGPISKDSTGLTAPGSCHEGYTGEKKSALSGKRSRSPDIKKTKVSESNLEPVSKYRLII